LKYFRSLGVNSTKLCFPIFDAKLECFFVSQEKSFVGLAPGLLAKLRLLFTGSGTNMGVMNFDNILFIFL